MPTLSGLRIVDPVLTSICNAYENESFVGEKLLPSVSVPKLTGKIPTFTKDAFIDRTLLRAVRANSNRIPPAGVDSVDFSLRERDVEISMDLLELDEASSVLLYEQRLVKELKDILSLGKEKAICDLLQTSGTFTSKDDVAQAWATANSGTPIADIKAGIKAVKDLIGKAPNTCVISPEVFDKAIVCDEVTDIIAYSGYNVPSKAIFAQMIGIPDVFIGSGYYSSDGGTTLTPLWSNTCVLAYVDKSDKESRSIYNPSFGYLMQKEGYPQVDTYFENGGKIKVVRNTDIYDICLVNELCGFLLYDCVSGS